MENLIAQLTTAMVMLYRGDMRRIQHFMKVYAFARMIALSEGVNTKRLEIIEAAALVHDIGIHTAERKFKSSAGCYQEQEGPPIARAMLTQIGFSPSTIERVCFLVGRHHTPDDIDDIDYQILIEADFLVNAFDDNMKSRAIQKYRDQYFRTETGRELLNEMADLK